MAHWIKLKNRDKGITFECSECGKKVHYIDSVEYGKTSRENICRYKVCPWCKADMAAEHEEEPEEEVIILREKEYKRTTDRCHEDTVYNMTTTADAVIKRCVYLGSDGKCSLNGCIKNFIKE